MIDTHHKIIKAGLIAVIILSPVSLFIRVISNGGLFFEAKLPFIEPLLWFLFVLWLFYRYKSYRQKPLHLPPLPFWAFLLVLCLSSITSKGFLNSSKELVQCVDYYIIFFMLLTNIFDREKDQKLVFSLLFIIMSSAIIYGLIQFIGHREKSYLISSLLDNRNILGAFLVIILSFFYSVLIIEKRWFVIILISIIIAGGILINTALASLFILLFVFTLINLLNPDKGNLVYLFLFSIVVISSLFVRINGTSSRELLFEPRDISKYHKTIENNIEMILRSWYFKKKVAKNYSLSLSTSLNIPDYLSQEYKNSVEGTRKARSRDIFIDNNKDHIRQRLLEWQSALNIFEKYPLLGVGPGNYQKYIGYHFYTLPKLNTLEPDTENGYLVIASTTGFLGLSVFVWILIYFSNLAWLSYKGADKYSEKGFNLALLGALISFIITNIFYNISNHHATILLFIFITALISLDKGNIVSTCKLNK